MKTLTPALLIILSVVSHPSHGNEDVQKQWVNEFSVMLKKADAGDSDAQVGVAGRFYLGMGTEQSYKKFWEYTNKAADLGHVGAWGSLCNTYKHGLFESGFQIYKNPELEWEWCNKAANAGNVYAQGHLGLALSSGDSRFEENVPLSLRKH